MHNFRWAIDSFGTSGRVAILDVNRRRRRGSTAAAPTRSFARAKTEGSYFPSFLEPRRRSEQAIVAVVLEAYVNGVSTRKVDRLVEQLGIEGMTKDRVSAICRALGATRELSLVERRRSRIGPEAAH
jgi:transposase-like protein